MFFFVEAFYINCCKSFAYLTLTKIITTFTFSQHVYQGLNKTEEITKITKKAKKKKRNIT